VTGVTGVTGVHLMEYEDTVEIKGKIIRILPAYKAMINDI